MNERKVVFDRPGSTPDEIMSDMRKELRRLLKTPRNAPCPCGAKREDGKAAKFKNCCLRAMGATVDTSDEQA